MAGTMSAMRSHRIVRANDDFFHRLDVLLSDERSSDGSPSRTDFLAYVMPTIVETLAADYEQVTQSVQGSDQQRVFVMSGTVVHSVAVYCELVEDVVVLVWLSIQPFGAV